MDLSNLFDIFKARCNTVHTFTRTKTGRKFLIASLITFILLFLAPLFHGSVGATLVGSVVAPMIVILWRRYDTKHAVVPAVVFAIPMLLDMLLYFNLKTATSLLVSIVCILVVSLAPAFSYIKTIKETLYAFIFAGCICAGIVIISALTTKYRDLAMLVGFGTQLWMYASPIAYDMSGMAVFAPGGKYHTIFMLNPITPIVNLFRYAYLGLGNMEWIFYGISWLITLVVLFIGIILFSKVEKTFMDTV